MRKITTKINVLTIGSALFLGISISVIFNIMNHNKNKKDLEQLSELLYKDYDALITNEVQTAVSVIKSSHQYYESLGVDADTIPVLIADVVRELRYGASGYFFIDKSNGDNVVMLGREDLEGKNRIESKDSYGTFFMKDIIKAGLSGGGYSDYYFPKAGTDTPLKKRSYSAYYEPFDWVVGTGNYIEDIDKALQNNIDRNRAASRKFFTVQIILLLILSIITVILASFMGNRLSQPIVILSEGADKIANGELSNEFNIANKDEVGILAKSLNAMGERMRDVISQIIISSDSINSASTDVDSSSQSISSGAAEQASSAEEISSSMEEMVANIQQNADNAQQTEKISLDAVKGIEDMKVASETSLKSIQDITEKITIVNDIAFQTNILALNAAVEAARAGEYGKGFAVVAAEVRSLAERSRVAANDISELSQSSLEVTERAARIMAELVPKIEKTSSLIQEISASSAEQSSGADQINNAIIQFSSVTQQNASASEELSANASELASQSVHMRELISFFKI